MTGNMSYAYPYPNYLVVCPTHCQGLWKYLFIFCVYMCFLYVLLLFSCPVVSDLLWSKFMSIESVMPSTRLILCCHLLLPSKSFSVSETFPMSWPFPSGDQNTGASVPSLWHCAFFMVQLSQRYVYVITGKTITLTIWTFVSRVVSLLFNTLSTFIIAFLLRSNRLLILWLQSTSAVILETRGNLSLLPPFPFYLPWSNGDRWHVLKIF